jgi:glycosyltransferase involved in cell wall biosynthesis
MPVLNLPQSSSARVAHKTLAAAEGVRPVRICYLIDELAAAGTETQLLALIRHLDRKQFCPYLCLLRGDNPMSQALEPSDCTVLRLGVKRLCSPTALLRAVRFARFLRRERIDVLQVYFPDSSYLGIPTAWLARVPHRIRTRNNLGHWMTPLHLFLGRLLNFLTTGTIANCDAARRALLEDERPDPGKVIVLENGVDLGRFHVIPPLSHRKGPRVVGAVVNLRPVKGLDVFLNAAAKVARSHPDVVFRIAGEGELRPELERLAVQLGLAERFHLAGSVADVPSFLAGLDVAVLPSRAEGMSNAVLEYMAAGRAVVATAVGATPELIEDGTHGLLVPPGDASRLADAINLLLRDPGLASRLGNAARQRVMERYSRAAMVRRFEAHYLRLTGSIR